MIDNRKALHTARWLLSFGEDPREVMKSLVDTGGCSPEEAFLIVSAAKVLDSDYECVPDTGNRKESCVQVISR